MTTRHGASTTPRDHLPEWIPQRVLDMINNCGSAWQVHITHGKVYMMGACSADGFFQIYDRRDGQ